ATPAARQPVSRRGPPASARCCSLLRPHPQPPAVSHHDSRRRHPRRRRAAPRSRSTTMNLMSTAKLSILDGKSILVTGGTGSFGKAFVKRALESDARRIVVFSRDEQKHYEMQRTFTDRRLRFFVGDIRDRDRLMSALRDIDIV